MTLQSAATTDAMSDLCASACALIAATPALCAFAPLPALLEASGTAPSPLAATAHLRADSGQTIAATEAIVAAVLAATPLANWQQTYSEAQVGADFLARYGWFELWGPTGHFHSTTARAYIAFWGAHLHYVDHWHEAEELYYVLAGAADFSAEGLATETVRAGETRQHRSNQPHAMITRDSPVLALVLWRGDGLAGAPYMPLPAV